MSHNITLDRDYTATGQPIATDPDSITMAVSNYDATISKRPTSNSRRKFLDEYIYERLFLAQKPFTTSILRALRRTMDITRSQVRRNATALSLFQSLKNYVTSQNGSRLRGLSVSTDDNGSNNNSSSKQIHDLSMKKYKELLPMGVHHINPSILIQSESIESSVFADFVFFNKDILTRANIEKGMAAAQSQGNDPGSRLAFSAKLDAQTRQIQDLQVVVQQLYECRIAALERYVAFCVMFHAMAAKCSKPYLLVPWDIARSQSNLRVATTGNKIAFILDINECITILYFSF